MRRAAVLIVVLLALAAGGLFLLRRHERPRNLILISIDTLRQDRVSAYGYPRPTTPALDALAARGVVFENASAPSPWTLPSHVSLLTGLYPQTHGATGHLHAMSRNATTLADWLRERGYATGAVVNTVLLDRSRGFARGFDHFERVESAEDASAAPEIDARALRWLDEPRTRPFFLFLHHYDVHSDYAPAERYRKLFAGPYDGEFTGATEQLKQVRLGKRAIAPADAKHLSDLYDAEVRQLDDELARFLAELEARGHLRSTVLIVTSDHGEEFLEHGGVLHGRTLHGELVRVPLVVAGAGVPRGRRVEAPVSLVDVFPTVTGLLGVEAPPYVEGIDLSPAWRRSWAGLPEDRPVFFEADWWLGRAEGEWKRAVRRAGWKLHYESPGGVFSLYDVAHDPGEQVDLAAREPARLEALRALLAPHLGPSASGAERPGLSPAETERLRALGYLE